MTANELLRVALEEQLHDAVLVADDFPACVVPVVRAADHELYAALRRILLRQADAAHLRDRVDAVGQEVAHLSLVGEAEGMAHRDASLLHRGRRERRETDDIARGVHARARGSIVVVYLQAATFVGNDADAVERKVTRASAATGGEEELLGGDLAAVVQLRDDAATFLACDGDDVHAHLELHLEIAHRAVEPLPHLQVQERQEPRSTVDERDLHVHRREHRRVFAADDSGTDDRHRVGEPVDLEHGVRIVHVLVVEGDVVGLERLRAGGDQHELRGDSSRRTSDRAHVDGMSVDERADAMDHLDPVAVEVPADALDLQLPDGVLA